MPRSRNLTRAIEELRSMLSAVVAVSPSHRLEFSITDQKLAVHADPAHIDRLMLNLVVNARDAMPSGGAVRVRLEAEHDSDVISVSDEGQGIDSSIRDRIFEPFFTTKGHGNGLGLSTVRSIVDQHGGIVHVASERGHGATFVVRLPRV